MKFTEEQLEKAIIQLLGQQGYPHFPGDAITRQPEQVLIKDETAISPTISPRAR